MAWNDFGSQHQAAALKAGVGYLASSLQARQDNKMRKFNNLMVRIQQGFAYNALTANANLARERAAEQKFLIQQSEYSTRASAENAAAATGTTGNSVQATLFDISHNAAIANQQVDQELSGTYLSLDHQRQQISFQSELQIDNTRSRANPATAILGFMSDRAEINERNRLLLERGRK